MIENHFRSHFSPFQINTQLLVFDFFWKFAPKTIEFFHYVLSMAMPNMKLIGEFMTQLEMPQAFWAFLCKIAARGHFVFPIDAKNHKVLVIWGLNGYGEYEFNWCICNKVMACTSVGVRRRNQTHNTRKIFKFRGYNKYYVKNTGSILIKICTWTPLHYYFDSALFFF